MKRPRRSGAFCPVAGRGDVSQKEARISTPYMRGVEMLPVAVPKTSRVSPPTPVTYWLSKRLLAYTAAPHRPSGELQARRRSVRCWEPLVVKFGEAEQLPWVSEWLLQRPSPW